MKRKISVGLLGATGIVGQQYVHLLENHPWFELTFLAASDQSAGKSYEEAVKGRWHMLKAPAPQIGSLKLHSIDQIEEAKKRCQCLFSAVSNDVASKYEERYAAAGLAVISNASFHRKSSDVPIIIPEVNPHHTAIIPLQQKNRGWNEGFIVVKPNCSLQSYMIPLAPLHKLFQIKKIYITTLQAVSGAGYPGVASLDILNNIIPFIEGEEEKSEQEPLKIWGEIENGAITPSNKIAISAQCNRVAVVDGHIASVEVEFEKKPTIEEILQAWNGFQGAPQKLQLPSAPLQPVIYKLENNRPQPRLDKEQGDGMGVTVGRLKASNTGGCRFVALSHNTIRGAAGGAILTAELLFTEGFLKHS